MKGISDWHAQKRDQGPTEYVECLHHSCRDRAHNDCPVPLCGSHIGRVYEYARDLMAVAGLVDEAHEKAQANAEMLYRMGIVEHDGAFLRMMVRGLAVSSGDRCKINGRIPADSEQRAAAVEALKATEQPKLGELVYYIQFEHRVKIGYSSNLKSRLRVIPHDEIVATEPGTRALESARHEQFRELRVTGEWFRFVEPLVSHVAALRGL